MAEIDASSSGPIVIAGGSGFIGVSLASHLAASGKAVVILSRNPPKPRGPWRHVMWDARTLGEWASELEGAAGLVNLVGRSVDCIKTPEHRDEIIRSRVEATRVLGQAMRSVESPPPVWAQMSTAHIYGDPPQVWCYEDSPLGTGFAPDVGRAWEAEYQASVLPTQRQVLLRTSFVVGRDRGAGGGALARLRRLVKLGLGGTIGSGTQGISWLHEADLNRLFERALFDARMQGTYLATAPNPVSQRSFMRELRRAMRVPVGLPAAAWMGPDRRAAVDAHRSRTCALWTLPGFEATGAGTIRVSVSGDQRSVEGRVNRSLRLPCRRCRTAVALASCARLTATYAQSCGSNETRPARSSTGDFCREKRPSQMPGRMAIGAPIRPNSVLEKTGLDLASRASAGASPRLCPSHRGSE